MVARSATSATSRDPTCDTTLSPSVALIFGRVVVTRTWKCLSIRLVWALGGPSASSVSPGSEALPSIRAPTRGPVMTSPRERDSWAATVDMVDAHALDRDGHGGARRATLEPTTVTQLVCAGTGPGTGHRGRSVRAVSVIDIDRSRRDTESVDDYIHTNNAGCSVPSREVIDTVVNFVRLAARIGGYEAQSSVADELAAVYSSLAELVSCRPDEIALFDSATTAWRAALYALDLRRGQRVVVTPGEYGTNLVDLLILKRKRQIEIDVIPIERTGELDLEALTRSLKNNVRLVSTPYIAANGLTVTNIPQAARCVADFGALLLVDACQAIGQLPLDVRNLGCHMMTFTGRKYLRAPRGTAGLFIRYDYIKQLAPVSDVSFGSRIPIGKSVLLATAQQLEAREKDPAVLLGLLKATRYATSIGVAAASSAIDTLAVQLRADIVALPGATVHDSSNSSGIVTFSLTGITASLLKASLREQRISVGTTSARHTPIDMTARELSEVVRVSPHYFNTSAEMTAIVRAIRKIATRQ